MLPSYGGSLNRYLFEPLDETTFFLVKNDVLETLSTYFSSVKVISLRVFSKSQTERNDLNVSLTLQLLDESLDIFDVEVKI